MRCTGSLKNESLWLTETNKNYIHLNISRLGAKHSSSQLYEVMKVKAVHTGLFLSHCGWVTFK